MWQLSRREAKGEREIEGCEKVLAFEQPSPVTSYTCL